MIYPEPDVAEKMTGTELVAWLREAIVAERSECARLADGLAERLTRSGKHEGATVALQISAAIKARGGR